ncbi:MAG: ISAs1 family transposase [Emticicia sp.]|nr:ISAs1 family transposase [Emticicia sp.]
MKQTITCDEIKSYYEELKEKLEDTRKARGIRHDLALVLTTMMLSILRSVGTLNVSVIHRQMGREHEAILKALGLKRKKMVSDVQFRRILSSVNYANYNALNLAYFNKEFIEKDGEWLAIDGKELRGNIDGVSGKKRGENIVKMVSHEDKNSKVLGFYHGAKESEKTVVKGYFQEKKLINGSFTFDALHTDSDLLEIIDSKGGIYLAQIKKNQALLLEDCKEIDLHLPANQKYEDFDKAHGREEQRKARLYTVNVDGFAQRWTKTNIQTLVVVDRITRQSKNNKTTKETAYFVSNKALSIKETMTGLELFQAIRGHWNVEADNWVRDVTLGEDKIQCKESNRIRVIASAINNALNLFRKFDINNNIRAFRENLIFDRKQAIACFSTN